MLGVIFIMTKQFTYYMLCNFFIGSVMLKLLPLKWVFGPENNLPIIFYTNTVCEAKLAVRFTQPTNIKVHRISTNRPKCQARICTHDIPDD